MNNMAGERSCEICCGKALWEEDEAVREADNEAEGRNEDRF